MVANAKQFKGKDVVAAYDPKDTADLRMKKSPLEGMKVGDPVEMHVKGKVTRHSSDEYGHSMSVEMTHVKAVKGGQKNEVVNEG